MDAEHLIERLTRVGADAEYTLDLAGLDLPHARESVARMLERSRFRAPRDIAVLLDPPPEGGGETLFQPIGRQLLDARRAGLLERLEPLSREAGLGYRIATVGNPEASDDDTPTA
ncbi:MAG: hypothetical protein HQ481_15600 [Alphaproteobacteria bacterium]|nr:hypothetical protein [Alphaproteobacteria bacterium]